MSVKFYTGHKKPLKTAFLKALQTELNRGDDALIVLVPEQLTLETEILTLHELNLTGSFRLNIMSPKRLCTRIFDEAGRSDRVEIDERGRAMLMGHVLRTNKQQLKWYGSARDRRGFEMRIVEEIIRMKQAGISPKDLSLQAEKEENSALKMKLNDLSVLYGAYEEAMKGRFQDGEDEMNAAIERMSAAKTLKNARVFLFGFDITTPIYDRFFTALAEQCGGMSIFLSLENNGSARDFSIYLPLQASYERLVKMINDKGIGWERERLEETEKPANAVEHFAREIFCSPNITYKEKNTCVQLAALKNPMEEARFAAALIRRLVMSKGWRYSDIMLLCDDMQTYSDALENAFEAYEVPLFTAESRSADRHALPRFLLESLKILCGMGDMSTFLMTGYPDVSNEEADELIAYFTYRSLNAREILHPFKKGEPETLERLEPIRQKIAVPLKQLDEQLSSAQTLKEQLSAIFSYMENSHCIEKGELLRQNLAEMNQRTLASEDAQVWNRVIGTLDQMNELIGEAPIPKNQLCDLLSRAFDSTQIKPLPQSSDSVNAVSAARAGSMEIKALIVIGATDRASGGDNGLLNRTENNKLAKALDVFLGSDALGHTRTDRMYMKNALSMAKEYLCVTYPMSTQEGTAISAGTVVRELKNVFPELVVRGGVIGDDSMNTMYYAAVKAAKIGAASELSEGKLTPGAQKALRILAENDEAHLKGIKNALSQRVSSEDIGTVLSSRVYGPLDKVSVTRLETFAGCPFSHFVKYALRPENEEPFGMNARDEGSFYHEAVHSFLAKDKEKLKDLSADEAVAQMNAISDAILEGAIRDVVEDSYVARASARKMRRIAARAARTLNEHLKGAKFRPIELEMDFGDGAVSLRLNTETHTRLGGRIDRIDAMTDGNERYLRIVDYKRSKQKLDAGEIYYGLQLQLILYLAEALKKYGGKCAGAFYFCIQDPVIQTESMDEEEIERERMDYLRMDGLLPNDAELIRSMAAEPDRVFKVKFTQSGEVDARSNTATEEEFALLIQRAINKASEMTKDIAKGVTRIAPVKTSLTDACRYCDYKGICMTDKRIPGGKPRKLKKLTFKQVYERLENGVEDE